MNPPLYPEGAVVETEVKSLSPSEVKFDDDAGTVTARFATLNVKDHDGDVTLPGFFGKQAVAIAWAHDRSRLVGKGVIREDGDAAYFDGKFFLDTFDGKQAYLTTKAMGDLQEWSYGFHLKRDGYKMGTFDGSQVRLLTPTPDGQPGAKVAEVSPVLLGAGLGTATVGIKSHSGLRFVDQAELVAQQAELLFSRAEEIAAMRAEKGKSLGDEAVARLLNVKSRLESAAIMLSDLAIEQPTDVDVTDPTGTLLLAGVRRTLDRSHTLLGDSR
jgi:hypothetical protein